MGVAGKMNKGELYRIKGELTQQQFQVSEAKLQVATNPKSKVQSPKSKTPDSHPLTLDPQGEAEACFLKAIDIAQHHQAKSLELRASSNLARLWQSQGKQKEAHKLLSEVYNWFTEGFDTPDLQEAKALLGELAEG